MQGRTPNDRTVNLALVHAGDGPASPAQAKIPAIVAFDRKELQLILSVYGRKVGQGDWRDYAMDFLRERAVFSVYARVSEHPLFIIEKTPRLRNRQGQSVTKLGNFHPRISRLHQPANPAIMTAC